MEEGNLKLDLNLFDPSKSSLRFPAHSLPIGSAILTAITAEVRKFMAQK